MDFWRDSCDIFWMGPVGCRSGSYSGTEQ